jgi:hypothetical protein
MQAKGDSTRPENGRFGSCSAMCRQMSGEQSTSLGIGRCQCSTYCSRSTLKIQQSKKKSRIMIEMETLTSESGVGQQVWLKVDRCMDGPKTN